MTMISVSVRPAAQDFRTVSVSSTESFVTMTNLVSSKLAASRDSRGRVARKPAAQFRASPAIKARLPIFATWCSIAPGWLTIRDKNQSVCECNDALCRAIQERMLLIRR